MSLRPHMRRTFAGVNAAKRSVRSPRFAARTWILTLGLSFSMLPSAYSLQGDSATTIRNTAAQNPAPRSRSAIQRYMYHASTLTLRSGEVIEGLFLGASDDTILIWQPGKTHAYGIEDASMLRLQGAGKPGVAGLYGVLFGGYLGLIIGQSQNRDSNFPPGRREFSFISAGTTEPSLLAAVGACLGGGAAYMIADAIERREVFFDFSGDDRSRRLEFGRLLGDGPTSEPSRIHIRASVGWLNYNTHAPKNAYVAGAYTFGWEDRDQFTVFRRASLTYSLTPWAEAGVGFVDFSEPSLLNTSFTATSTVTSEESSANQFYCALGVLKPLWSVLPSGISWEVGGGIGLAAIDYRSSNLSSYVYGAFPDTGSSFEKIQKSTFGVTLFTGLTLYPAESLSLGFVVDYTFTPAVTVRAEPLLGLDSRTLGNVCLGIELGIHP